MPLCEPCLLLDVISANMLLVLAQVLALLLYTGWARTLVTMVMRMHYVISSAVGMLYYRLATVSGLRTARQSGLWSST